MFRMFNLRASGALLMAAGLLVACGDDEETNNNNTPGADAGMTDDSGMTGDSGMTDDSGTTPTTSITQPNCPTVDGFTVLCENITGDALMVADQTYLLSGLVFVESGRLTIEAGTTIVGDVSDGESDALVVTKNATIEAIGTADAPVVFTSAAADPQPGDFGGVVLLGNASINVGSANIEGMGESDLSSYGGTDDAHNCGALQYVRIEYAGSVFGTDNELNGLTLGGCGSATVLDHIQSHRGLDDGIEFFGGTANMTHAVISFPGDDGLDWDEGYRGEIQYIAITGQGDNGIEADNLGDDPTATPMSNPTIWNITIDCNGNERGMNLRVGTGASLNNVIITRCEKEPFDIRGAESVANWQNGDLSMNHVIAFGNGEFELEEGLDEDGEELDDDGGFIEADEFNAENVPGLSTEDPMLDAGWVPASGSPAANGDTPGAGFDAAGTHYGAFPVGGPSWAAGWINLN